MTSYFVNCLLSSPAVAYQLVHSIYVELSSYSQFQLNFIATVVAELSQSFTKV